MADGSRSSSAASATKGVTSAWLRWALPSMADLVFVAILAALLFTSLSVKLLNDAGIGWHIRTGQQILATQSIPRVDPFSSQVQKTWIAWEWLYDVIVGALERSAGLNGVVWFTAVVIAGTFALVFRILLQRGSDPFVALVLTLLAITASMIHFLARPHVLSWLMAVMWFWILDSMEFTSGRDRRAWLLPPLMLIWVNLHGGFLLGFVLLAIYWLGSVVTWVRLKETRIEEALQKIAAGNRVRELTLVGFASAIASLVNPYGWVLHGHIYEYLTNRFLMDHIEEFQSPNFHGIAQKCFLLILLAAVAALATCGRKLRLSQALLMLFAMYAGLYASRNIPISSIFLVLIVGPLIPRLEHGGFSQRMGFLDSGLHGHLWPIFAVFISLGIALNAGHIGSATLMNAHFDPERMPVAAVNFIQQSAIRGPVLGPDYWGGYLIYRLYPRNSVVIDDRHDFYGEKLLRSYITMIHVEPGWEDFLKGRSSCLVLPRKATLSTVLSGTSGWKAVYSDDLAVVFLSTKLPQESHRAQSQ